MIRFPLRPGRGPNQVCMVDHTGFEPAALTSIR